MDNMHRLPPFKIPAACGTCGILDRTGACFSGADVVRGMANMHERGNGLGAGFVAYGELTEADKREFTDLINALAEPLSQLTSTILE